MRPRLALALAAAALAGCGAHADDPAPPPATSADPEPELAVAEDRNPDPRVVEVSLTARPARLELRRAVQTDVWTYDGVIPGPLLRANVGDRLVVHFTNDLPEPTTIHWHGVRVPNAMDGTEETQAPVPPGGRFDYDFVVPDAGTYWYHPHSDAETQLDRGLFGALVVVDPAEPAGWDEATIVLGDAWLADDGSLEPPDAGGSLVDYFGREGNVLLVNGRALPTFRARAGVTRRWRLVNAADARYFQLALGGHRFTRIGGDQGLLEAPVAAEPLVLAPGERADVLVTPQGAPGDVLTVRWVAFDHGVGSAFEPAQDLFRIALVDPAGPPAPELPSRLRAIAPVDVASAVEQRIELTGGEIAGEAVLGIDGKRWPDGAMLEARAGETHVWTIANLTDADHPFHLHGFPFQLLDRDGVPPAFREWKDTLNVPNHTTARIAIPFDDRTGKWMFHCHILSHVKLGMMGMLMLAP